METQELHLSIDGSCQPHPLNPSPSWEVYVRDNMTNRYILIVMSVSPCDYPHIFATELGEAIKSLMKPLPTSEGYV